MYEEESMYNYLSWQDASVKVAMLDDTETKTTLPRLEVGDNSLEMGKSWRRSDKGVANLGIGR